MNSNPFASDLAGLPSDLAAELEDHLMESMEAGLRSGQSAEEARQSALRSLGSPLEIAQRCQRESDPRESHRVPMTPQQRVAVVGWLLLATGFASRVCAASDPSHGSIAACVGLSAGSLAMALLIRRARIPQRLAIGLSLGLTGAAVAGLLQAAWQPWIQDSLALTPAALAVLALFGALSGGALTAAPQRTA
ncbi:MAG: permease prefix domain 1-containing protein [Verrucomicrobiota bacterium]